jgi:cysteinyl-tRNA synthetase
MSGSSQFNQDDLNNLLEDARYVENEADALRYVIDEVPYDTKPAGGMSIAELLLMLDHAQKNYYRPIIEQAFKSSEPIDISDVEHYRENFEVSLEDDFDIFKALQKISKHRAALVNVLSNIPLIDWSRTIYKGDREMALHQFVRSMITDDRKILKEIADLVMNHSQQVRAQKEIEQKSRHRRQGAS